jgi:hypothetical protein
MFGFDRIPTQAEWRREIGGFGGRIPPAMVRIDDLLGSYHQEVLVSGANSRRALQVAFLLYRQCDFVLKKVPYLPFDGRLVEKAGGEISFSQRNKVRDLQEVLERELRARLNVPQGLQLRERLMWEFGRYVNEHSRAADEQLLEQNVLQWYPADYDREHLKLSFRNGLAERLSYLDDGNVGLQRYDTQNAGDALEFGGSLYVMDRRGRIYVTGRDSSPDVQGKGLKHSSVLGGDSTLCAGTMRVENGRVVWVSGKSGHYQPTVAQMVNLLERLYAYGVDLNIVTVYRENFLREEGWVGLREEMNMRYPYFEPCPAWDLLRLRAWPTGVEPQSMRVGNPPH